MKKIILFLSLFILSSCQTIDYSKITEEQVKSLTYEQVCASEADKNVLILKQRKKMNFSCNFADDFCRITSGHKAKTPAYGKCILETNMLINQQKQSELYRQQLALMQMQQGLDTMNRAKYSSSPTITNCNSFGTSMRCTSW